MSPPTVVSVEALLLTLRPPTKFCSPAPNTGPIVAATNGLSGDEGCRDVNGFQRTPTGTVRRAASSLKDPCVFTTPDEPTARPTKANVTPRSSRGNEVY